jgi:hypothetical protein
MPTGDAVRCLTTGHSRIKIPEKMENPTFPIFMLLLLCPFLNEFTAVSALYGDPFNYAFYC